MRRSAAGSVMILAFLCVSLLSAPARGQAAPAVEPGLSLRLASTGSSYERPRGEPVYLSGRVFVTAPDAPFELQLTRPDYAQPVQAVQALYDAQGRVTETRPVPSELLDGWNGLGNFLHVTIRNRAGEIKAELDTTFCPNNYDTQRVNDSGPALGTYPTACYGNPFTRGMVWGIDHGWAAEAGLGFGAPVRLRDGRYNVSLTIAATYVGLFNIDPSAAAVEFTLRVVTSEDCCFHRDAANEGSRTPSQAGSPPPTIDDPDPSLLPDLVALPSWGISVQRGRTKTRLSFGATVWAGGASSLVVEGFRREGEDVMDAYQYFYENGEPVGRSPVGTFAFDARRGHFHWHFRQFARYSLLSADQTEVVLSKKEAFCLAPTDAIDLMVDGAERRPENVGLFTSCGGEGSLWVREILPLGWGDTYFQGIAGQSFNITDLPNGTYYIAVEANPGGSLYEQTSDNNVALREIRLKGRPDRRRVVVPPWNGIDTEWGAFERSGH